MIEFKPWKVKRLSFVSDYITKQCKSEWSITYVMPIGLVVSAVACSSLAALSDRRSVDKFAM